jgi:threonine dehydratase
MPHLPGSSVVRSPSCAISYSVTTTANDLVSAADLADAERALRGVAVRTPLLPAPFLGDGVWIKPEMLQRGGAFKLRGAYNFMRKLPRDVLARGVVAPSSGNHAQAVALAAQLLGVPATVVMPTTVTAPKRSGAERLGARIELAGTTTADRMERALEIARTEGATLVPPYDDPDIIAGQGTIGLEILADLPDVATVLVPVGGGGLSAGVATAIKLHRPQARVIGVEPAGAPKLSRARTAGAPVKLDKTSSIADGLLAVEIGHLTFAHHQRYIDDVALVDDAAMRRAMRMLLDRAKLVAEPSGAVTVAALMERAASVTTPVVAVLSGGNIEWDGLSAAMG